MIAKLSFKRKKRQKFLPKIKSFAHVTDEKIDDIREHIVGVFRKSVMMEIFETGFRTSTCAFQT